jgi:hypothetical protein
MSNINRPRVNMKPCKFDGATDRDSNGQCHCRNVAYREVRKAVTQKTKIMKAYDGALLDGASIEDALAATRAKVPALVKKAAPKKAKKAEPKKVEPERYTLQVDDDLTEDKQYARKDAAIKNGVRSGEAWKVIYKGKVVAESDDLI